MAKGQHGFKKGKSTLTAISEVIEWVDSRTEIYVMGVFLDTSGEFDNVKWEPLIQDMKNLRASIATVKITESYLRNRTAKIRLDNTTVAKILTKGCPQGSGFGPSLWNITVNQILATEREDYPHRGAYADDIVTLIAVNTRKELLSTTEAHIEDLCLWANRYGLAFSMSKTMGMVLKGELTPGFYLKFGNGRIKTVGKVKYLGVEIDQELKYKTQATSIIEKSTIEFSRLRGIVRADWGLSFEMATILY